MNDLSSKATTFGSGKLCSHGEAALIFEKPFKVWAGAAQNACPIPKGALLVDLADMYTTGIIAYGVKLPKALTRRKIHIEWPDMGKAPLNRSAWNELVAWFKRDFSRDGVFIACQAGHGRTGSALAILGKLLDQIPEEIDPIDYVREKYCDSAVESSTQIEYISNILGYKTKAKPSSTGYVYQGGTFVPVPCTKTVQGMECLHTCYATSKDHVIHWCKACKWDWYTNPAGNLVEVPGPEIKANFDQNYTRITGKAEIIDVAELKQEPVKSAEESAATFQAAAAEQSYKGPCYSAAPEDLNTKNCFHLCDRADGHSGQHECEFCKLRWPIPVGAGMVCHFRWNNTEGCGFHKCDEDWGHRFEHGCADCMEVAPHDWD